MSSPSRPLLRTLRGRLWRLAVLCLWAAFLSINLSSLERPAQAATWAEDLRASLCHSGSGDGPSDSEAAAPHCPLCHIAAATILAAPGWVQVALLAPATEDGTLTATPSAPPGSTPPAAPPQPRGPPVSV